MPEAIETTKRKFHKLLEGLTTPTQSKHSALSDFPVPAAKRVRLVPTSRISAIAARKAAAIVTPEPTAFSPWSHPAFLARLSTFSSLQRWTPKPSKINEVAWAARGWSCSQTVGDINTVVCKEGCGSRLVISLKPPLKDGDGNEIPGSEDPLVEPGEELIEMYFGMTDTAHEDGCIWRGEENGCKSDVYRLMIARPTIWRPQLKERYLSFAKMPERLPSRDVIVVPPEIDLEQIVASLSEAFFHEEGVPGAEINRTALALALFGWKGNGTEMGSTYGVASCEACFRRVGLWLYAKKSSESEAINGDEDEPMKLDVIDNHRDYCPWINGDSQSMTGTFNGKAAWEVLQVIIRNHAAYVPVGSSPGSSIGPRETGVESEGNAAESREDREADVMSVKSREEIKEEDRKRFARLRELSRSMGLKRWRVKAATDPPKETGRPPLTTKS